MDVLHYFDKVDFSAFYENGHLNWKYSIGSLIEKNTHSVSEHTFGKLKVAIVGAPFDSRMESGTSPAPDKIREELYQLAKPVSSLSVADFGNIKPASSVKGNYQALRDVIDYFAELKITVIILGGSQDLTVGACDAFANCRHFSLSVIDSHLDLKKGKETFSSANFLSRIFSNSSQIFQFNLLAYQSHLVPDELFSKIPGISQNIRLGKIRSHIARSEPVFRNTDVLSFDIGAVKYAEAPGNGNVTPNGLSSDEACRLARYAGLSSRIKAFGLFNITPENKENGLTVKLGAQVVWYFLEGHMHRQADDFKSDTFTRYQVEVSQMNKPLVFLKNTLTNQWWMEIETLNNEIFHFGCSKKDYEQAARNEIPELWIKFIQKLDETLK